MGGSGNEISNGKAKPELHGNKGENEFQVDMLPTHTDESKTEPIKFRSHLE